MSRAAPRRRQDGSGNGGPRVVTLARLDLRADRSGTASLAVLVLITTVLAAAVPVVFTRSADAALPAMMAAAPALQRDLGFTLEDRIDGSSGDPLADVMAAGEELREALPPSVAALVDHGVVAADTVALEASEKAGDGFRAWLRLRAQPNIEQRIRYVSGRAPAAVEGMGPIEIALSTSTAALARSGLDDAFALDPELGILLPVHVVGIFEAIDPSADDWADRALLEPTVINEGDGDRIEVTGTALIATEQVPGEYGVAARVGSSFRLAWRFILDWQRTDAATRASIINDLAALRVSHPFSGESSDTTVPSLSTGLLAILERYARELAAAQAAMTLALIGPACAALGALGMIAATIARRRQDGVRLLRARGASDGQVLTARAIVASLIVLPAALVGGLIVVVLAGAAWLSTVGTITLVVAGVAVGLAIATTAHRLRESDGQLRQARPAVWWGGPRSLVRDGLLIAVAIAGVIWIGQRGATGRAEGPTGAGGTIPETDPLLLLVPVLVALAGALIAWRAYVPIVRAASAVAAAHPGFVAVHALRGPARGAGSLQVPLVVLVVTIAVGVFSAVVVASLQHEQDVVAWRTVGADYRVESATRQSLPVVLADVPGVEASADVVLRDGILSGGSVRALQLMGAALDVDAYRQVVAGTPADGPIPDALWTTAWTADSGLTPEAPIPAVLVGEAARRPDLRVGDPFELSAFGAPSHYVVAKILPEFPGATSPKGTVIVPLGAIRAAEPDRTFVADQSFVRAPAALGVALHEATIGSFGAPNVGIVSRADVRAAMEADPLVRDTSIGFGLALLVAVAFSMLVVAVAVVRDVAGRQAEIALLRALGTLPRQVLGVIGVEQGTVVITAVTGGLMLGCLMGIVAVPSLGLDRFVRPGRIVDAAVEWPVVSGVALSQAVLALLVMIVATIAVRRRDPVPAMMRDA
ncbi:MAG TPA: ABC transporter permease [Candidatus Limnocylindrales bacterium]